MDLESRYSYLAKIARWDALRVGTAAIAVGVVYFVSTTPLTSVSASLLRQLPKNTMVVTGSFDVYASDGGFTLVPAENGASVAATVPFTITRELFGGLSVSGVVLESRDITFGTVQTASNIESGAIKSFLMKNYVVLPAYGTVGPPVVSHLVYHKETAFITSGRAFVVYGGVWKAVFAAVGFWAAWTLRPRLLIAILRSLRRHCWHCGYIIGRDGLICPECGASQR